MPTTARLIVLSCLSLLASCGSDEHRSARGPIVPAAPTLELRIRLSSEDEITVWRVDRNAPEPTRIYSSRLSASERQAAVRGLEPVFVKAAEDPHSREPDGASSIRLQVEADPMVPFKHVQWVMVKAAHPRVKIYRLSLLGRSADERMDLELPKDRSCCPGQRVPMRELRLKYFRVSASAGPTTRVRVADDLVEYDDGYMEPVMTEELMEGEQRAPEGDAGERAIDLPSGGTTWHSDVSAWKIIEQELRARWRRGERAVGVVSVAPPTGGDVPYRDVLTGMLLLRSLGVEQVMPEGAIAPIREEDGR